MKKRNSKTPVVTIVLVLIIAAGATLWWRYAHSIRIESIRLTSPYNSALLENVEVKLDKPAAVYVEYWKDGTSEKRRTPATAPATHHTIHLVLLEPATTYHYRVVLDRFINAATATASFHTRKQSPWMVHNWIKEEKPHDAAALGDGLVMLCYAGRPGYIAMVDGAGNIRWYWQVDDIGVRAATLTPRGTILALLHPSQRDEINDIPDNAEVDALNKMNYPIRRGRIGYAGGTALAEIDPSGKMLWRVNIHKDRLGYELIHHDLRMDSDHHIITFIRDPLPYDMSRMGGTGKDTLWGDALVKIDTTGRILWKWSAWSAWDIPRDPRIKDMTYDRFHLNALYRDRDGNYLVSPAILNQIWKVNATTGKLMWKLGEGGDFKMDTAAYFHFQHDVNVTPEGDVILFDNGDPTPSDTSYYKFHVASRNRVSRVLSFRLDTAAMTAATRINITLPESKYSSRMGSAYVLPDKNLLVTSAKTGSVLVLSPEGKVLWELDSYFIPYRAEYVPDSFWKEYIDTNE